MSEVEDFLSYQEEQEIVKAIIKAEQNTSGEIRVHIERQTLSNHYQRAREVFHYLKMDNTKEENGVLLYIAVQDRKFVIYGDHGIDKVVPKNFWNTTRDTIAFHFSKGNFKEGIISGVLSAGKELELHFPWHHGDINELNDEVSKN